MAWFGTLRKTYTKFEEIQKDKQVLDNIETTKASFDDLEYQAMLIDTIFKKNKELNIKYISQICSGFKNVQLISFPDAHSFESNGFLIKTYVIELKGDYFELLELTKTIESNPNYGFLISLSFENKMNYKLKRDELYLRLFLQKYADL